MKKVKILAPLFAFIVAASCSLDSDPLGMAPCPDCNQPTTCWQTENINGQDVTFQIPCGTDDGGPGLPPPPPPTPVYPATPESYCAPASYPSAPKNGQMYRPSTAGSTCLSHVYYYSCSAGWVVPVTIVSGTPPTTGLYSGLRYASPSGVTYVYLVNFASQPTGWFYIVTSVSSTGCGAI